MVSLAVAAGYPYLQSSSTVTPHHRWPTLVLWPWNMWLSIRLRHSEGQDLPRLQSWTDIHVQLQFSQSVARGARSGPCTVYHNLVCPGTHYASSVGLKLKVALTSWVLELQSCATTSRIDFSVPLESLLVLMSLCSCVTPASLFAFFLSLLFIYHSWWEGMGRGFS